MSLLITRIIENGLGIGRVFEQMVFTQLHLVRVEKHEKKFKMIEKYFKIETVQENLKNPMAGVLQNF